MFDIYEEVKDAKSIGISGHVKPDGDCIGSCLATYLYLKKRMPAADIRVYLQKPGHSYRNVCNIDKLDDTFSYDGVFDAFIAIDTVPSRMDKAEELFNKARKTINIDHHVSNANGSGMVNYIRAGASSASELVFESFNEDYLDADIASLLYLGIAHDTGVFRYSSTTGKTLSVISKLLEYDFDFARLIDETFFAKTYNQLMIQAQIVTKSKLFYDGQFILGIADSVMMQEFGVTKADFEGVVEHLRNTEGVRIACFIYEKTDNLYKISFRSADDMADVSKICEKLGGGGHVRAAGCDYSGRIEDLVEKIELYVSETLGYKTNDNH